MAIINLDDQFKPKKRRRSGLSWVRLSGRVKVLSFVAMFAVSGSAYLLYTHAATSNIVQPGATVSPTPTPSPSGVPKGG